MTASTMRVMSSPFLPVRGTPSNWHIGLISCRDKGKQDLDVCSLHQGSGLLLLLEKVTLVTKRRQSVSLAGVRLSFGARVSG